MSSVEEAALEEIITNPSDDAPRLIYADWLEEQGLVERAEFIRLQCELALPENRVAVVVSDGAEFTCIGDESDSLPLQEHDRHQVQKENHLHMMRSMGLTAEAKVFHVKGPALLTRFARDVQPLQNRQKELLTAGNFWKWFGHLTTPAFTGSPTVRIDDNIAEVRQGNTTDEPSWRLTLTQGFVSKVRMPQGHWIDYGPAFREPLERVELADRRPSNNYAGLVPADFFGNLKQMPWHWSCPRHPYIPSAAFSHEISRLLWQYLESDAYAELETFSAKCYKTKGDAEDAMSRACLLYAKDAAS